MPKNKFKNGTKVLEIANLLELAEKTGNESIFQAKHKYKKFKDQRVKFREDIQFFINELFKLNFFEECVFWCNKLFEDLRICDKYERYQVFNILMMANYSLKNYEKALENGKKATDLKVW